jgi:hypothetical protein
MGQSEDDRRRDNRKQSYSKAFLPDHHIIGYIRDVSKTGFRMEAIAGQDPGTISKAKVVFIPQEELRFPPFTLEGAIQWTAENPPTRSIGIEISRFVSPGSKRHFRRFERLWRKLKF